MRDPHQPEFRILGEFVRKPFGQHPDPVHFPPSTDEQQARATDSAGPRYVQGTRGVSEADR